MMCNNTLIPLGEILIKNGYIRGPFGSSLKRDEMETEGIPVYEQQHAIYGTRNFRYYISNEKFETLKRFKVQRDDLIVSCSGTVGKVSTISEKDPIGIISQALLILRANSKIMLPCYLMYYLSSASGNTLLISESRGSVQSNISSHSEVEKILIPIQTMNNQKKIVKILSTIDNKIRCNISINDYLAA